MKKIIVLIYLLFPVYVFAGGCSPSKISESEIKKLKYPLSFMELNAVFGKGCLGGMTAMTYQYKTLSGDKIWFWLSNKPVPAFNEFERAMAEKKLPNINVLVAVKGEIKNNPLIIWPEKEAGKTQSEFLGEAYLSK